MAEKSALKSAPPATPLNQKFWSDFAANFWEKRPLALKNVRSSLSEITDAEIFDLLVTFADLCRKRKDSEGFKFYIEGFKVGAEEVLQVLPVKKDKSLLGYHKRIEKLFSDYCLVCDDLLKVSSKKQHCLTDFTDQLYRHVGFPNRFSEIGLYLGNYRKTPFGVHVDSCGVFSFPVVGKKRFRLWTSEFVKKNPKLDRAFKYGPYKKQSQVLEANAGDMTYWPSSAWHIAESDGSFSATWSLGVWVNEPHVDLFSATLKQLIAMKSGPSGQEAMTPFKNLHASTGEVTELPEAFIESIELLKNLSAKELQETFLQSWTQHISSQGFKNLSAANLKLSMKSRLRLQNPRALVLWRQSNDKINFSFAGTTVEVSKAKDLLALIETVNSGETCRVQNFFKGPSAKKNLAALQTLANVGAFSVEA